MKQILTILILALIIVSCKTYRQDHNQINLKEYYSKKPDLSGIVYLGGDGSSIEEAIIVKNAKNSRDGIASEYSYVNQVYGKRNIGWSLVSTSTNREDEKLYEIFKIKNILSDTIEILYFDITEFYGKF